MAKKKTPSSDGKKVAISTGIGALVAAAAGAYYLYGTKEGSKQRKKIQGWALKMKGDVLEELEKLENVSENKYREVVNAAVKKYEVLKHVDSKEVKKIAEEMKGHWKNVQKHIEKNAKKVAKKVTKKRPAKRKPAKKKVAKKTPVRRAQGKPTRKPAKKAKK